MSTLAEIQEAVIRLPGNEKKALQMWLDSQVEPLMPPREEQRLLQLLDEAMRKIDAGQGVPLDEVRKRIGSWVAK
jgi:hypothetical protein